MCLFPTEIHGTQRKPGLVQAHLMKLQLCPVLTDSLWGKKNHFIEDVTLE